MQKKDRYVRSGIFKYWLQILLIFIFTILCTQTVFARSQCVKDSAGFLACDVSVNLLEERPTDDPDTNIEWAWHPTVAELAIINNELEQFSGVLCESTLGKSRIHDITVFTDYRKSSSDIALYKDSGRSYAYVGSFISMHPSIIAYYSDLYAPKIADEYLDKVLVHEFSHAAFKVYDEYIEIGVTDAGGCLYPIESDNPRRTIMNDHTIYTRYSHPDDYADVPPAQTAQYRCYGKSAWEVLLQPKRCDKDLSLHINAYSPRRDYFVSGNDCMSQPVPTIEAIENPQNEQAVADCKAQQGPNINFLLGQENVIFAIDSDINSINKAAVAKELRKVIDLLALDVDIETALMSDEARGPEAALQITQEKKLAILDFNGDHLPVLIDIKSNRESLNDALDKILQSNVQNPKTIDQNLNAMAEIFANEENAMDNDHNVAVVISATPSTPSTSALAYFKMNKIPLHAIGISDGVNSGLRRMSTETGGRYFTVSGDDDAELLQFALRDNLPLSKHNAYTFRSFTLDDSSTQTLVWVAKGTTFMNVSLIRNLDSELKQFSVTPIQQTDG